MRGEEFFNRSKRPREVFVCEYCRQSKTTVEKLTDDEEFPCEWFTEEGGPGACAEPAEYAVSDWFVDEHLCETHKRKTKELMEEGLGDFLDSVGFHSEYEIKPILQEETCDYTAPDSASWSRCGKKARYAKYILDTCLLCAEHTAEAQREAENG
jgi:hypothetical protein